MVWVERTTNVHTPNNMATTSLYTWCTFFLFVGSWLIEIMALKLIFFMYEPQKCLQTNQIEYMYLIIIQSFNTKFWSYKHKFCANWNESVYICIYWTVYAHDLTKLSFNLTYYFLLVVPSLFYSFPTIAIDECVIYLCVANARWRLQILTLLLLFVSWICALNFIYF